MNMADFWEDKQAETWLVLDGELLENSRAIGTAESLNKNILEKASYRHFCNFAKKTSWI